MASQDGVKERIKIYLKECEISQARFCKQIGLSPGYIGAMRKSFQPETINKIVSEYPDLNITWLLTGDGDMLNKDTAGPVEYKEFMTALQKEQEMLSEALNQNARLLGIIERMQGVSELKPQKSPPHVFTQKSSTYDRYIIHIRSSRRIVECI